MKENNICNTTVYLCFPISRFARLRINRQYINNALQIKRWTTEIFPKIPLSLPNNPLGYLLSTNHRPPRPPFPPTDPDSNQNTLSSLKSAVRSWDWRRSTAPCSDSWALEFIPQPRLHGRRRRRRRKRRRRRNIARVSERKTKKKKKTPISIYILPYQIRERKRKRERERERERKRERETEPVSGQAGRKMHAAGELCK